MNYKIRSYWFLFFATLSFSCNTLFIPQRAEFEDYRITEKLPQDSAMLLVMKPYRDSVNKSMNEVIGIAENTLDKNQPEGTLGNFMADAIYHAGRQKFNTHIDAAFINYGGIRITQLAKGEVTKGKVFELMPFDNLLVLQKLRGNILQLFLDLVAERGGWPVAGLSMQIRDKKAVNVWIGAQLLDPAKTYTVINSDYVVNGGDNAVMLKNIPQQNIGYLMRDAIFDYIKILKAEGKNISVKEEKRVTHAQ